MEQDYKQETKGIISSFKPLLKTYHTHHNTCYMLILSANVGAKKDGWKKIASNVVWTISTHLLREIQSVFWLSDYCIHSSEPKHGS